MNNNILNNFLHYKYETCIKAVCLFFVSFFFSFSFLSFFFFNCNRQVFYDKYLSIAEIIIVYILIANVCKNKIQEIIWQFKEKLFRIRKHPIIKHIVIRNYIMRLFLMCYFYCKLWIYMRIHTCVHIYGPRKKE